MINCFDCECVDTLSSVDTLTSFCNCRICVLWRDERDSCLILFADLVLRRDSLLRRLDKCAIARMLAQYLLSPSSSGHAFVTLQCG